jgi:nicotinamidase-related amidase
MELTAVSPFKQLLNHSSGELDINPNTTALIVVDMQYFDAHPDWGEGKTAKELGVSHCFAPYFEQITRIIPNIQQLLQLFRQKEMEVIHIRVAELTANSRDVAKKQLVRGLIVPSNSKEADFLDEVQPVGDEIIISKSSSGVFPVTNFDRILRNLGITTLVFTGTSTGGCVESAVQDAVDLGYEVIIIDDACASSTEMDHRLALARMDGGLVKVISTADCKRRFSTVSIANSSQRSGLERVKAFLPQPLNADEQQSSEPYDLIFPPAVNVKPNPNDTGLVLIDIQRLTCDPEVGLGAIISKVGNSNDFDDYYHRVETAKNSIKQLLEMARDAKLQVIHVYTASHRSDGKDLSRKLKNQGINFGCNSAEAELMDFVNPRENEIVLRKPASGIFTGTGLDDILRNLAVKTLILIGVSFDGALEGSIRGATDRGYQVLVVPEASVCASLLLQDKLWGVQSGLIRVKTIAEIRSDLSSNNSQLQGD